MTVHQSLRGHLALGLAAVAFLMLVVFGWGMLSEISGAVIAPGKLVVDSNVKKVQHPTGGVVDHQLARRDDRARDLTERAPAEDDEHQDGHGREADPEMAAK